MSGMGMGVGIGELISQGVQNLHSRWRSDQQFDFSRAQAEEMEAHRKTGFQTLVMDLKKAGLNPALAYQKEGVPMGSAVTPAGNSAFAGKYTGEGMRNAAEIGLINEQKRNVGAEADRNEEIAKLMKAIAPRVVEGVGAVESTAKAGGDAAARIEAAVVEAMKKLGDFKMPDLGLAIKDVVNSLLNRPQPIKMPEAVKDVESILKMNSPPRGGSSLDWGRSEYERAQDERRKRSRESPASRRRSR